MACVSLRRGLVDVGRTARRWLRGSERFGRMLGNTVDVYHIYICVFGNSLREELYAYPNNLLGQNKLFAEEQSPWPLAIQRTLPTAKQENPCRRVVS